jgi:hypothetical protein
MSRNVNDDPILSEAAAKTFDRTIGLCSPVHILPVMDQYLITAP